MSLMSFTSLAPYFHPEALHNMLLLTNTLDLSSYTDQTITIRGFLYQNTTGEWFLAGQPHLKSCCVGDPSKDTQQINLLGSFDQKWCNCAATIEGTLSAKTHSFYSLKDPIIVDTSSSTTHIPSYILILGVFLGATVFFLKRYFWKSK